eukprot:1154395-Alexandrium_andersonii.AAC.1
MPAAARAPLGTCGTLVHRTTCGSRQSGVAGVCLRCPARDWDRVACMRIAQRGDTVGLSRGDLQPASRA